MLTILLAATAFAGGLVVDAKIPVEIYVDRRPVAQTHRAARLELELPAGATTVTVVTAGTPELVDVDIPEEGHALLLVGKSGTTVGEHLLATPAEEATASAVEFRVAGTAEVLLQIDDTRHRLAPGETTFIELSQGSHPLTVRNGEGTVIWARGTLRVDGGTPAVVQVAEGRMPEVAGGGGSFSPDRR